MHEGRQERDEVRQTTHLQCPREYAQTANGSRLEQAVAGNGAHLRPIGRASARGSSVRTPWRRLHSTLPLESCHGSNVGDGRSEEQCQPPRRYGMTTTEHEERVKIRRNGTKVFTRTNRVIRGDTTTEYEESEEVRRNGTKVYKRTNREIIGRR